MKEYREQEGDICIEFHDHNGESLYAVGRWHKGLYEWVGRDFRLHRFQGNKVLFTWQSALKIVSRLEKGVL